MRDRVGAGRHCRSTSTASRMKRAASMQTPPGRIANSVTDTSSGSG
jgi:hypothetical protein